MTKWRLIPNLEEVPTNGGGFGFFWAIFFGEQTAGLGDFCQNDSLIRITTQNARNISGLGTIDIIFYMDLLGANLTDVSFCTQL